MTNRTIYTVVGLFMILMAIINVIPTINTLANNRADLDPGEFAVDPQVETANELNQAIGGPTSPMGLLTVVHAPVMLVIGIMLLLGRRWEMFAAIAIIVDALVKGGNILSQLAVGQSLADSLVPIVFIVLDIVATVLILQQWRIRRREEGSPTEAIGYSERQAARR